MKALLPLLVLALAGCATGYQRHGASGGYSDTQLAPDMFRVSFSGNGYAGSGRVHDFALLRAAELTLKNGFTHFQIASSADASTTGAYAMPTTSTTTATATRIGSTAHIQANTVNSGGAVIPIRKPGIELLVKCYKGKPVAGDAFDAAFLQRSVKSKYQIR